MAQIQNIQNLHYNNIDLCVLDMGESSHLINEYYKCCDKCCDKCCKDLNCCNLLEYIGPHKQQRVSDYCSSWDLICCMITREGQSEADVRYMGENCPDYVKQVMKLEMFNCYSIVLTDRYKGDEGIFQSMYEVLYIKIEDEESI